MILVTQGHELGIGLEVFIKSFLLLSKKQQEKFTLFCDKQALGDTLRSLKISFSFINNGIEIYGAYLNIKFINNNAKFQSTDSLNLALNNIKENDILLTLPTSKDQLEDEDQNRAGYTEFLRKRFSQTVSMLFSCEEDNYLLITDHIPLSKVGSFISKDLIVEKVSQTIDNFPKYFSNFKEVIFAGINPHCGESGLLGSEDSCIDEAIKDLKQKYASINFRGPYSGDTLHTQRNNSKQLLVYMFHDQGLPVFKAQNNVKGLNVSLGLPFLRMSVDHGTAFDLYGKNQANYMGCHYLLTKALEAHKD